MDSTNSGSIQSSSSDGDDDYDSRPEAISSFLNLPPPPPPPPPSSSSHHLHHHPSPSSFISLSPFFNPFPSTPPDPNPLSLDMPWAKSLPSSSSLSDPSCTIIGGLTTTNSSSSTTTPSFKTMAVAAPGRSLHSDSASLNPSSVQPPAQPEQPSATPRASKKRSRASRRAPTTVLTTDTSNFRAMVQEFTGFPAAPFIASPFSRPRLDLFHATAAAPPYLLRPFAQKVQTPLFSPISSSSSSSTMADVAAAITRNSVANANTSPTSATCSNSSSSSTTSSSNYQLLSMDLGHPNLLRNPNFTFQSPLRPPTAPNQSSSTMPTFGGNPPLGASDYAAGGLGSLITMEGTKLGGRADGFLGWDGGSASGGRDQSQLRPGIANYGNLQLVSSHAEKGSESMTAARGDGRVDSWILSSD